MVLDPVCAGLGMIPPRDGFFALLREETERRGILLIYRARPIGGALAAHDDVSEARWFAPAEIPWRELAFESTAQALREWADPRRALPT